MALPLASASPESSHLHDRSILVDVFQSVQQQFIDTLECLEANVSGNKHTFERKNWQRSTLKNDGGTMAFMRGNVFEKVGVNFSSVQGTFPPEFGERVLGVDAKNLDFWASGVSFVGHPRNPLAPTGHLNVRAIETTTAWFGGGGDLTPAIPFEEDSQAFHTALQNACPPEHYGAWKQACDNYFYLPHRKEPRGVGGVFFDHLNVADGWNGASFLPKVALAFLKAYAGIVEKRCSMPYTEEDKQTQLRKRSRYVEFNLLYDRGTLFGLQTGGNIEAILMSLPPLAAW